MLESLQFLIVLLVCINIQETGQARQLQMQRGRSNYKGKDYLWVDIPGTYSIMSNSEEEEIARNYICFGNPDATVVVVDATCLERNLNLVFQIMEITKNSIIGDVLDKYPNTAEIFFSIGMHCLGCPASRGETIEEACAVHGANVDELITALNEAIA